LKVSALGNVTNIPVLAPSSCKEPSNLMVQYFSSCSFGGD
jgi:hypothetical protein